MISGRSRMPASALWARSADTRGPMVWGVSREWNALELRSAVFARLLSSMERIGVVYLKDLANDGQPPSFGCS